MATPTYRIYYGKYPDAINSEIPNSHIKSVSGLQFQMEPGKPGEPTVDEVEFKLKNLDHNGTEIYPRSWFETESRSEAEGAIVPLQLFFRIEMPDYNNHSFTGVLRNKKYGKFREQVSVTIEDLTSLIKESGTYMMKSFEFPEAYLANKSDSVNGFNGTGYDLNGDSVKSQFLDFTTIISTKESTWHEATIDHPYFHHRNYNQIIENNDPEFGGSGPIENSSSFRCAFIKIGENTILTKCYERLEALTDAEGTIVYHKLIFPHADNGNSQDGLGNTVIERGRFYSDDEGSDLQQGQRYSITILDYNLGHDNDIILHEDDVPFSSTTDKTFYHGCEVQEDYPSSGEYSIQQTSVSFFNIASKVRDIFNSHLFSSYYETQSNVDLFDLSMLPTYKKRYAFYSDLIMYGWQVENPIDIIVNLAIQLNSYVYFNESGKIVFHPRNYHEDYLPDSLPPNTFEVDLADIKPLGDYEEDHGFDSFEVEITDRIEINNVESEDSWTIHVGEDGIRDNPALRSDSLEVINYRTGDLGVPHMNSEVGLPLFRYSPDDSNFNGGVNVNDLTDFIPTAAEQAKVFAGSWSYPTILWKIQWSMNKYSQAGIGSYFWVNWGSVNRVYIIRDITHSPDEMLHKMEVQEVGEYNGS